MAASFSTLAGRPEWFATSDPPGGKLGSGGGVAHLLVSAWREQGGGATFAEWLRDRKKLALLAGGQSRRLPAYAAPGKILLPMPALRWAEGQRLDQTLLDLQAPDYERVLRHAPETSRVLVASGDVMLRFAPDLPEFPEADVIGLGMWVDAETASHFGVFFVPRTEDAGLAFFLQKPSPAEIRRLAAEYLFLVDTGMWLLSARAVEALLGKCGWDGEGFAGGAPGKYELYADLGPALGATPRVADAALAGLTAAVVALPEARFHHFGTTRQMIESASELQNADLDQSRSSHPGLRPHPDVYVLNSDFRFARRSAANRNIWVENCALPAELPLTTENVLTGFPAGAWDFALRPGVCIDLVPVGGTAWCPRVYGFDDTFSGPLAEAGYLGEPFAEWLARRGLDFAAARLEPGTDIQLARIFPVLPAVPDAAFLQWLIDERPAPAPAQAAAWLAAERISAQMLGERANLVRLAAQRRELTMRALPALYQHRAVNIFPRLDLDHAAALYAESGAELPPVPAAAGSTMDEVHDAMFRGAVRRHGGGGEAVAGEEARAFDVLRNAITAGVARRPASPRRTLMDDQIAWARSPVRLDLAGGWSDTPPYCLQNGGAVVNVAVNLNGQPPVQVYVRQTTERHVVLRSIDLGAETKIRSLEELTAYNRVGDEFSLAKGALALAGFEPRFGGHGEARSLDEVLEAFGGGIELSMLAATPKGSGLGTSSILGATLLGALSESCGLGWDARELFQRTMALEQLLTSGGGWQDQAGGIFRGLKLVETAAGLAQRPEIRWLPTHLFGPAHANQTILLYYTGLKRVAKHILQEVVRGMFLNRAEQLNLLAQIKRHAYRTSEAIQRDDAEGLARAIAESWRLNQELDAGTNPPAVAAMLASVQDFLAGAKLLGAGGGGYLLMFAKDAAAAARVRETLEANPPNALARFVDFQVSETGMQVTRS